MAKTKTRSRFWRCLSRGFGYPLKEWRVKKNKKRKPVSRTHWHNWVAHLFFSKTTVKWVNPGYASPEPAPCMEVPIIYKGIIFDLDGTLVNSLEDIADSMNSVLQENNLPTHPLECYKLFVGKGIRNLVRQAIPEENREEELVNNCYRSMVDLYRRNSTKKTRLYDGIAEMLDELSARGLKLAILSNKADELTQQIVSDLLSAWHFEVVTGLHTEAHKKPNPIIALQISEKFGVLPEEIIYVGDTSTDMLTATNAGMYAVGVLWGFRTKEELIRSGAKYLLSYPSEIVSILVPA